MSAPLNFAPTADELALADRILAVANDAQNSADPTTLSYSPTLSGDTAVAMFSKAEGIPPEVLFRIWEIVDEGGHGRLSRNGVAAAVRLLGWAQAPVEVAKETLAQAGPLPHFAIPELTPPISELPPFTPQKRSKYLHIFRIAGATDGIIDGNKAQEFLNKSNLPVARLSQIWALADLQRRGFLDGADFAVAMYLTQNLMSKKMEVLPSALPEEIYAFAREGLRMQTLQTQDLPPIPANEQPASLTSPTSPTARPCSPTSPTSPKSPTSPRGRVPMPIPQLSLPPTSPVGEPSSTPMLSPGMPFSSSPTASPSRLSRAGSPSRLSPADLPLPMSPSAPAMQLSAPTAQLSVPDGGPRRRANSAASSSTSATAGHNNGTAEGPSIPSARNARTMPTRRNKLRSKSMYMPNGPAAAFGSQNVGPASPNGSLAPSNGRLAPPNEDDEPRKPARQPLMHMASVPADLMHTSRELMQRPMELYNSSRELYQNSRDMLAPGKTKKRREDVERRLEEAERRAADAEAERRMLQLLMESMRTDLDRLRGASEELGIHKTIIADLTNENERLKEQLRDARAGTSSSTNGTSLSLEQENAALRRTVADQEETLRAFQAADSADTSIAQVQAALARENEALRHSRDERVARLQEELAALRSERDADRRLVQGTLDEGERLRAESERVQAESARVQAEGARVQEELAALRARAEAAEREAGEVRVRLEAVQRENERLAGGAHVGGGLEHDEVDAPPPAYTLVAEEAVA
ncbi:hypothetical protein K523DRAFT_352781 [Schizophyllum commune Tattone D]|nr:hypothetical protein K523DRAFT_352781 [Schizophyllum commune Tattone D]